MVASIRGVGYQCLRLDALLPAPVELAWPMLTEPELMSQWSTAPVNGVRTGDGDGYGSVGAARSVVLPLGWPAVAEVVQYAQAPDHFVYRIVGSRAVRHHRGALTLIPDGNHTRLSWTVELALAVPALERAACRALRGQLTTSLRRLTALLEQPPDIGNYRPGPDFTDDDPGDALATAYTTARAQRALADDLAARDDPRHWFGRVYQYVTEAMIDACERGVVAHKAWALRLIPRFHHLFDESLRETTAEHWQRAYAAIDEAASAGSSALTFWRALVAGARAHIEGDLPRTLATVYREYYAGRCDYARFRADFLLLDAPLGVAWQRLSQEIPSRWFPGYLRVMNRALPPEAVEHLTARRFYDPLRARRAAFEHGNALL